VHEEVEMLGKETLDHRDKAAKSCEVADQIGRPIGDPHDKKGGPHELCPPGQVKVLVEVPEAFLAAEDAATNLQRP